MRLVDDRPMTPYDGGERQGGNLHGVRDAGRSGSQVNVLSKIHTSLPSIGERGAVAKVDTPIPLVSES